ncbi:MAG: hypothetical protein M1831_004833 [Alyxoria varia]|nr:MAG: hypothetical protein M1831_004833 [Alyxoria varia]
MLGLEYELSARDAYHHDKRLESPKFAFQAFVEEVEELHARRPKKKRKTNSDQAIVIESPQLNDDVCVADFRFRFSVKASDNSSQTPEIFRSAPSYPKSIPVWVRTILSDHPNRNVQKPPIQIPPEGHCRVELSYHIDVSPRPTVAITCAGTSPIEDDTDLVSANGYKSNNVLKDISRLPATNVPTIYTQSSLCTNDDGVIELHTRILWRDLQAPIASKQGAELLAPYIYSKYVLRDSEKPFQQGGKLSRDKFQMITTPKWQWKPQDFYENVHVPDPGTDISMFSKVNVAIPDLYRFQKRAVLWMIEREGGRLASDGTISSHTQANAFLPPSFAQFDGLDRQHVYASQLLGCLTYSKDLNWVAKTQNLKGGVLSEEMGLGKTVELISLICINRRVEETNAPSEKPSDPNLKKSSATLIITPSNILQQWQSELAHHAPHLKVFCYKGVRQSTNRERSTKDIQELTDTLLQQDVVLTTFQTLTSEFNYAKEKPIRNMRQEKKYEPISSPLVQIHWWRVCIDEAQMLGTGLSNAAAVAVRIPRLNAWAVSGTPVRKEIDDLCSILLFLQFAPFYVPYVWTRMLESHKDIFLEIFGQIALRHTKQQVKEDLDLPPQRRVVITLPFSTVEEERYDRMFQTMCDECGLDREGGPLNDWFDPNDEKTIQAMRNWLHRLRQTCLHPQVGTRNRQALGRAGPLRSIDEVLEVMVRQNEDELRSEQRNFILQRLVLGQVYLLGKSVEQALEVFQTTLQVASTMVAQVREEYEKAKEKIKAGKLVNAEDQTESENEIEGESLEDKHSKSTTFLRSRLRLFLEAQHTCVFFVATAYYQIKSDPTLTKEGSQKYQEMETEETRFYEQAKRIRKELLSDTALRVKDLVNKAETTSPQVPTIQMSQNYGGIESRRLFRAVDNIRELLNAQQAEINSIREKLSKMLSAKLVDQEDDLEMTGEEYEESTKLQDEQYVYLFMFKVAIADRHALITGQINELVKHEIQEARKVAEEGQGHAPELQKSLVKARSRFSLDPKEPVSMRSLLTELRSTISTVRNKNGVDRATAESTILEREFENLRQVSKMQIEAHNSLSREYDLYRLTMNARLEFYRQLQIISDSVKPLKEETDDRVDLQWLQDAEAKTEIHVDRISSLKTKTRFLEHLRTTEDTKEEESRLCVICQSTFETGVLTVCGHQFCKGCILLWWRQHRNCPVCKTRLSRNGFHNISYRASDLQIREQESCNANHSPTEAKNEGGPSIYSSISPNTLEEIKNVELKGSYGTKIDTLARHLIWIRHNDPGSKSIIFSQFGDFLDVLGRAFQQFQIGFTSISRKDGITRFRDDTSVETFLLHAKADSSGLTLVNATHVFLCEPLVNTAIELQAIARVHRIGQTRPTTVWMYLIRDTVEEGIYEMAEARRLDLIRQRSKQSNAARHSRAVTPVANPFLDEDALDATESLELQSKPLSNLLTKGKDGGESVSNDDLWSCLFTKRRNAGSSHLAVASGMDSSPAREVGRHLRAQAAEGRTGQVAERQLSNSQSNRGASDMRSWVNEIV